MRRLSLGALFLALCALALPSAAGAAQPQTSLHDIEDEVMCPICGTLLELSNSPQAKREKVFIAKLIATGKTKAEIEDALVAEYGKEVLALPRGSGFDLSAYLVPIIAFLVAAVALAIGVTRWRRDSKQQGPRPPGPASTISDESAERLDADLARYDL